MSDLEQEHRKIALEDEIKTVSSDEELAPPSADNSYAAGTKVEEEKQNNISSSQRRRRWLVLMGSVMIILTGLFVFALVPSLALIVATPHGIDFGSGANFLSTKIPCEPHATHFSTRSINHDAFLLSLAAGNLYWYQPLLSQSGYNDSICCALFDSLFQWRTLIQSAPLRSKLKDVIEKYRQANYTRELPSRAVKEILQAADENQDGMISLKEIQHLLDHIDKENSMSDGEIRQILNDLGADDKDMVPVETIKDLLSNK